MKSLYRAVCLGALALASLFGCGKDPDRPQSLAQQQSLMNGSYKPTKDQLAEAMTHVHFGAPKGGGTPAPAAEGQKPLPANH